MSGTTLTATILGVDKASPVMDKVGGKATETGGKFSAAAKLAAGAMAGIGVANFFKDSISAFVDAQAQTQKLEDAFEKFPKLGDTTAGAIEQISKALEAKTKFDDDATNGAAAVLAQFDLTGKQIETLIPLMQDYAVATGKSLPDAATDLGKAMEGQTKALKAVGINYTSTGDQATDFTNIVGLLQQKVGGFAENEGKTAAGQLEILKNQFGEVEEAVGGAVVPALTSLGKIAIPVLTDVANAAGKAVEIFGELPGPVKAGVLAVGGFVALSKLGVFQKLSMGIASFKQEMALATYQTDAGGKSLTRMQVAGGLAKDKIGSLAKSLGPAFGVAAATAAVTLLTDKIKDWTPPVIDATQAVDANTGALNENAKAMIAQQLAGNGSLALGTKMGVQAGDLTAAIEGNKDAHRRVIAAVIAYTKAQGGSLQAVEDGARLMATMTQSADALSAAQQAGKEAAAEQAAATKDSNAVMQLSAGTFRQAEAASNDAATSWLTFKQMVTESSAALRGAFTADGKTWTAYGQSIPTSSLAALHQPLTQAETDMAAAAQKAAALKAAQDALAQKTLLANEKQIGLVRSLGDLGASLYDSTGKLRDLNSATSTLVANMDRAAGITPDVTDATRDWEQSLADADQKVLDAKGNIVQYGSKILDAKGNITLTSQAGRDLSTTMEDQQGKAAALATALGEQAAKAHGAAAGADAVKSSLNKSKQAFLDNASQMGLTAAQAKTLADKYFAIPKDVYTMVVLDKQKAQDDLQRFADQHVVIPARVQMSSSGVGMVVNGARASGGPVSPGNTYRVGERGEELLTMLPGGGGYVTPNDQIGSALDGRASGGYAAPSSSTVIENHFHIQGSIVGSDPRSIAVWLKDVIAQGGRHGVQVVPA